MSVTLPAQEDLGVLAEKEPWVPPGPNARTPCKRGRVRTGAGSFRAVSGAPACTALTRVPLYG